MARQLEESELGDVAELAFMEIQDNHAQSRPPITQNSLILKMQKDLDISVRSAIDAVKAMEVEYLHQIAAKYPDTYMIAGKKVNHAYLGRGF